MRSNKRVAVTGASGFVGSHLVAKLLLDGVAKIICLVRSEKSIEKLDFTLQKFGLSSSHAALDIRLVDLTDFETLCEVVKGCDALFHTAAKVSFSPNDREKLIAENVTITELVAEAALECEINHFIHLSSIAVLEDDNQNIAATEESVPKSILSKSPYSISKFLSEGAIWRAVSRGLNVTILMPAVIIGEGDNSCGGSAKLTSIFSRKIAFYTTGATGYVAVEDVVRAMCRVWGDESCYKKRYLLCSENLNFRDIITRLSGSEPKIKIGDGVIRFAKKVVRLLEKFKIYTLVNESLLDNLIETHNYDGNRIVRELGFKYNTIGSKSLDAIND